MMSTLAYLKSFFQDKDVASVTPTSKFCVRKVCSPIDFSRDINIIEYGAGAGVFSRYLLEHMSPESRLYLFETNKILFEKLQEFEDSRVFMFDESVEHVTDLLPNSIVGSTDYIISGIPFSFLDNDAKKSILEQSYNLLRDGGRFLAYQTSGHLKDSLDEYFDEVETDWEWRNIPPMTVYHALKSK